MKYRRFEELPAWNAAIDLAVGVFELSATGCFQGYAGLKNQFERAAVSVSNNIAEGFERGTRDELLNFLYIARGSAGEVRSMLCLMERLPGLDERRQALLGLKGLSANITHQLNAWLDSLKSSDGLAPRQKSQETRKVAENVLKRDNFLDRLRQVQEEAASNKGARPPDPEPPS